MPSTTERAAEPFEELRAASDRATSRVRARPPIFLANLGTLSDYNARASWAKNFFAAGGIEALDEGGFTEMETLLRAFQRSPAPVACICASAKTLAGDARRSRRVEARRRGGRLSRRRSGTAGGFERGG